MNVMPVDIEAALNTALGWKPTPLPPSFEPPLVHVRSNGGTKPTKVTDRFAVGIQCYGATWKEADDVCRDAVADLLALEGGYAGDAFVLKVDVGVLPYINPDPSRPNVPRMTAQAYVTCKSIVR